MPLPVPVPEQMPKLHIFCNSHIQEYVYNNLSKWCDFLRFLTKIETYLIFSENFELQKLTDLRLIIVEHGEIVDESLRLDGGGEVRILKKRSFVQEKIKLFLTSSR